MRFSTVATAVLVAGIAHAQVDDIISDIKSVATGLPDDIESVVTSIGSEITDAASSIRDDGSDLISSIESVISTATDGPELSSLKSVFSSVKDAATDATETETPGAAAPTALPAMGAVAGGIFALAGLL
ncbi:hypothetical protein BDW02DRAFT_564534 [Decorospora gaudefroyi]|uniref:Uncharacterized protein n=1 Tax=Decorospora gaudefroyi TaxID=184978 RepID=A0A6A5KRY8_9PLEO|nr:hypothetical protein BDW02DRAFT_564534 [Decorospora gaudefroyi]